MAKWEKKYNVTETKTTNNIEPNKILLLCNGVKVNRKSFSFEEKKIWWNVDYRPSENHSTERERHNIFMREIKKHRERKTFKFMKMISSRHLWAQWVNAMLISEIFQMNSENNVSLIKCSCKRMQKKKRKNPPNLHHIHSGSPLSSAYGE